MVDKNTVAKASNLISHFVDMTYHNSEFNMDVISDLEDDRKGYEDDLKVYGKEQEKEKKQLENDKVTAEKKKTKELADNEKDRAKAIKDAQKEATDDMKDDEKSHKDTLKEVVEEVEAEVSDIQDQIKELEEQIKQVRATLPQRQAEANAEFEEVKKTKQAELQEYIDDINIEYNDTIADINKDYEDAIEEIDKALDDLNYDISEYESIQASIKENENDMKDLLKEHVGIITDEVELPLKDSSVHSLADYMVAHKKDFKNASELEDVPAYSSMMDLVQKIKGKLTGDISHLNTKEVDELFAVLSQKMVIFAEWVAVWYQKFDETEDEDIDFSGVKKGYHTKYERMDLTAEAKALNII